MPHAYSAPEAGPRSSTTSNNPHELARKLMDSLGPEGAEQVCRANAWDGVLRELQMLAG